VSFAIGSKIAIQRGGFTLLRARSQGPRRGDAADKYDEFPSPHGLARAKDYIGYEKNITFLDRELCPSLHPRAAAMSALGH
jgi:hypothetical protein